MTRAALAMAGALVALTLPCATAQADVGIWMSETTVAPGATLTVTASGETGVRRAHSFPIVIVRADRAEHRPSCREIGFCASETSWPIGSRYRRLAALVFPYAGDETVTLHAPSAAGRYRLFMAWWRPTQDPGKVTLLPIGAVAKDGTGEVVSRGGIILVVR